MYVFYHICINSANMQIILVAVIVCFLICWTPYHVQRIMFVIVTKKDLWNKDILNIQDSLHMVAGKYAVKFNYLYAFFIYVILRTFLLI